MARPIKEGMDYFPHDTDAVNDEKIEVLRTLYGNDGYAFYFILLERIYRTPDFELDISDTETMQILSRKISVTMEKFEQMLQTALKWSCFDKELYQKKKVLTSKGIKKRASVVVEKRVRTREKYQHEKQEISDAETTQETTAESTQSKVKKSKVKNIYTPVFEKFWDSYPRRTEKQKAFRVWSIRLREGVSPDDLVLAAVNYAKHCSRSGTEERFVKHPATFLGPDKPYFEWVNVEPPKPEPPKGDLDPYAEIFARVVK